MYFICHLQHSTTCLLWNNLSNFNFKLGLTKKRLLKLTSVQKKKTANERRLPPVCTRTEMHAYRWICSDPLSYQVNWLKRARRLTIKPHGSVISGCIDGFSCKFDFIHKVPFFFLFKWTLFLNFLELSFWQNFRFYYVKIILEFSSFFTNFWLKSEMKS